MEIRSDASPGEDSLPPGCTWLVDGYNALHAVLLGGTQRREWWTESSRAALVERARQFQDPVAQIWVIFDGPRPAPPDTEASGRVRVVFAPSADDWIAARVRNDPRPSGLVVVSLDRAVAARARQRGARAVTPHRFLAACGDTV